MALIRCAFLHHMWFRLRWLAMDHGADHVNSRVAAGRVEVATERLAVNGDDLVLADLVQGGDSGSRVSFGTSKPATRRQVGTSGWMMLNNR